MTISCEEQEIIYINNMRTQFFHCDICKAEITDKMSVFVFNETIINKDLQVIPVTKQADFCESCSEELVKAIDEIQKKVETKTK